MVLYKQPIIIKKIFTWCSRKPPSYHTKDLMDVYAVYVKIIQKWTAKIINHMNMILSKEPLKELISIWVKLLYLQNMTTYAIDIK